MNDVQTSAHVGGLRTRLAGLFHLLGWQRFARLNPWARSRKRRLDQYLETEQHQFRGVTDRHRTERDKKQRRIELELFNEHRQGSNWLENREMRMSAMMIEDQRVLVVARVNLRKTLGVECRELLSDAQLSKLEENMVRSVHLSRQVRRSDYKRRANAAGVCILRPEQRDAAEYGELEALIRREVRQLSLDRSLRRIFKPSGTFFTMAKRFWSDPVCSKVIAWAVCALITGLGASVYMWTQQHRVGWSVGP